MSEANEGRGVSAFGTPSGRPPPTPPPAAPPPPEGEEQSGNRKLPPKGRVVFSLSQSGSNRSSDLLVFGVLAGLQLAVDEVTVHDDLERTTRRWDEPKAFYL